MKIYECLNKHNNCYIYYYYVTSIGKISAKNLAEGQSLGWFNKNQIRNLNSILNNISFEPSIWDLESLLLSKDTNNSEFRLFFYYLDDLGLPVYSVELWNSRYLQLIQDL